MSIKSGIKRVKQWCEEHERELVICGVTAGVVVGTVVINKKFGKAHHAKNALPSNYTNSDLIMHVDGNSINLIPMESEFPNGDHNYYRNKYSNIPDGLHAPEGSILNFVSDNCINYFASFADVEGEPDLAVLVFNDATNDILDNIDIDDIKNIQMLIDLK